MSRDHLDLIARARGQVAATDERTHTRGSSNRTGWPGTDAAAAVAPAVPGYEVFRELHRGGQGVVFLATQVSTGRRVALKVLRDGRFANQIERERFGQEVRILATLRHPNIVTIHDSGTADGVTYFVMDYIDGPSLDAYIQANRPSVEETLRVFLAIADAINAAHQRGVIHRDLKPSNVRIDRDGQPHVLDFGLAKSIEAASGAGADSDLTRAGEFIGSLPWASPEQAEGRHDAIDVRTDVYALGLLLHQMLAGELPYHLSGTPREILGAIVEAQPKPLRSVRPAIDADLETIVLKCLAKAPARRYQTAGELARDVERYRDGRPIEARRDSQLYVFRKYVGRHRLAAGLVAMLLLALLTGAGGMFVLWRDAVAARAAEARQRETADARAADAEAVTAFLQRLLAQADPSLHDGEEITVRAALDEAAALVEAGQFAERPRVAAAVRHALGKTYAALGVPRAAERHLRRALELHELARTDDPLTLHKTLYQLAGVLTERGETTEAESLLERGLALLRAEDADDDHSVATTTSALARCHQVRGELDEAANLFAEALELMRDFHGGDHVDVTSMLNNLGLCRLNQGRHDEAQAAFRQSLDMLDRLGLHESLDACITRGNVAICEYHLGRPASAVPLFTEAIGQLRSLVGHEHTFVASMQYYLGRCLRATEQYPEAEAELRQVYEFRRRVLAEGHSGTLAAAVQLAAVLIAQDRPADAERVLRESLPPEPPDHPQARSAWVNAANLLADVLIGRAAYEEAERLLQDSLTAAEASGLDASFREATLHRLIELYEAWDRAEDAAKVRSRLEQANPPGPH